MHRMSRRAFVAGGCCLSVFPAPARTQEQPLRIVFPFAAGGSTDAIARLLAEQLAVSLGRAVIVDNRAGAGGRLGVKAVTQAQPDGATLLFATGPLIALQPHIYTNLGYDPLRDLLPISQVMQSDLALAVGPETPAQTLHELTAWLRTNPAKAVYGSPGAGTASHFAATEFARQLKLELRHVSYRGTGAALPDLLGGRLPTYIAATPELVEHHRAGRIRIVATTDATRSPLLQDVPTFKEQGVDIVAPLWVAIYAPSRTPTDVATRLNQAIVAALQIPKVRERILTIGFQPTGTSADDLRRIQNSDFAFWGPIVKASDFTPEP
jgi:tripartite-type tricarboxylate transporter receptor subunit TctC